MKLKLIQIGNSKGFRLSKSIMKHLGLEDEADLEITNTALIIRPSRTSRFDWAKSFRAMAENGDDNLLDESALSSWDREEWEWK